MAPLTKEQRSEAARAEETNPHNRHFPWWGFILIGLSILVFGVLVFRPQATQKVALIPLNPTSENAAPTEEPPAEPTPAPTEMPTEAPTEPVATTEAPAPAAISCDTPSIKAGLNAADIEYGEYLDTVLGKRMTFTSRRLLVPNKAWNDPLTSGELKTVEETWQYLQVCIPDEMFGRIFASGFEQGTTRYESGVLMTLEPGMYEFNLLNGEIVLWYPEQDKFEQNDLVRIFDQIRNGNFDIHSELAFFATTTDLLPKIPADLVQKNNVQIVPSLNPTIK